jgi:U3 small nucleolar RNA-associated protein 13
VVNVWDLRDYSLHTTVPIYEAVETVLVVPDGCGLPGCTTETTRQFLTVGERGIVQIWNSEG